MTQACCKIPLTAEIGFLVQTVLQTVKRYGNIWQGEAGEVAATEYAVKELSLSKEVFDKRIHGFDGVMRGAGGELVIVEAKATKASGLNALSMTSHGREGSVEWVKYKAELMCDPTSSFYTPANAKIGEEILRVGAEKVKFLVIHMDPSGTKVDVTKLR